MIVRLALQAAAELEEARTWYDGREVGIGDAFLQEVGAAMTRVSERPEAFPISFARMRKVMLRRFPYFLLYEVFPDVVIVFGVIHGARDPQVWMRRGDT